MKWLKLFFLGLFLAIVALSFAVFVKPALFINNKLIVLTLKKTVPSLDLGLNDLNLDVDWIAWNKRKVLISWNSLCGKYAHSDVEVKFCVPKFNWSFDVSWTLEDSLRLEYPSPLNLNFSSVKVVHHQGESESVDGVDAKDQLNLFEYDVISAWSKIFALNTPDWDINMSNIEYVGFDQMLYFSVETQKSNKNLFLNVNTPWLNILLELNSDLLVIKTDNKYRNTFGGIDVEIDEFLFQSDVTDNNLNIASTLLFNNIPVSLSSFVSAKSDAKVSFLDLKKQFLNNFKLNLKVSNVEKILIDYLPPQYTSLPAPLNALEGSLEFSLYFEEIMGDKNLLDLFFELSLNFEGAKQEIEIDSLLVSQIDLLESGFSGEHRISIDLKKMKLNLPQISIRDRPPQFLPDSRFSRSKNNQKIDEKETKKIDLDIRVKSKGAKALALRTNLLDEEIRFNIDFDIRSGEVYNGSINVMPLNTTVFRRPIKVSSLKFFWNPKSDAQLTSDIWFNLPEYKVLMKVEGPVSNPRYAFESVPPLSQDDIYSVLLFGKPLMNLDPDDRSSAQRGRDLFSRGLFSMSTLYFLSGTSIESIGYDADSQMASASVRLNQRHSLRVEGNESGRTNVGLRRSLGGGWYLDSSVQRSGVLSDRENDYGVLLERIIAY